MDALAFPVLAYDNHCNLGDEFFEPLMHTKSPFFKILCNGEPLPLISHADRLSPILV